MSELGGGQRELADLIAALQGRAALGPNTAQPRMDSAEPARLSPRAATVPSALAAPLDVTGEPAGAGWNGHPQQHQLPQQPQQLQQQQQHGPEFAAPAGAVPAEAGMDISPALLSALASVPGLGSALGSLQQLPQRPQPPPFAGALGAGGLTGLLAGAAAGGEPHVHACNQAGAVHP